MKSTPRRTRLLLAVAALLLTAVFVLRAGDLWRAAYPYLPARVQALPYRIQMRLPGAHPTPVELPTVSAGDMIGVTPRRDPDPITPVDRPAATDLSRATGLPMATGIPMATSIPMATDLPVATALPPRVQLEGIRHSFQTWNNCGPATISMALSRYGSVIGQSEAARSLKPDPDDKNVSPGELAEYARGQGYGALVRVNGDRDRLRALLAEGVVVVVETWFIPEPNDEMGHYRVLTGYEDDAAGPTGTATPGGGYFTAADSFDGPHVRLSFDAFDRLWRVFNRTYVPVYPLELSAVVTRNLGADLDDRAMFTTASAHAEREIAAGEDVFGWFNLASSLNGLGDTAGAAKAYDRARALKLPWRMLWYQFGPFEAYAARARWSDVLALADANLKNAPNLEESHYWRGRALAAQGRPEEARKAWERALSLNPGFRPAQEALEANR